METTTTPSYKEMNLAIARFMGTKEDGNYIHIKGRLYGLSKSLFPAQLRYHNSWDWIMPVVEKISTIHFPDYYSHTPKSEEDGDYADCAYPRTFGMRDKEGNYMVRINASVLITQPKFIDAVYLAVYDFVEWYNSQTPKP